MNGFMRIYCWTLLCVVNFMCRTVVCMYKILVTVLYMFVYGVHVVEKRVVAEFHTPLLSAVITCVYLYTCIVVSLDGDTCMS